MSLGITIKTNFDSSKIQKTAHDQSVAPLRNTAAAIRKTAIYSIRYRGKGKSSAAPSAPGTPPKTTHGRLRKSIFYDVDKKNLTAYIGPNAKLIGTVGSIHEFGGTEKRKKLKKANFKLVIGGHGPIDFRSRKTLVGKIDLVVTKLKTAKQVDRAKKLADNYVDIMNKRKDGKYPSRPFMNPAFEKIRPIMAQKWRGSVTKG